MIHPTSAISVARLACCADDSTDQGSCRIRLPASVWAAAGISYHKPVVVSIPCDDAGQPWRLLCIAALDSEEVSFFPNPAPNTPLTPRTPQPLSPSPQTPATPAAVLAAVPPPPHQQRTPPVTSQKQRPQSSRRCPIVAARAVVDPTVVLPPPDRMLHQLRELLMQPTGPSAEVTACRGTAIPAAAEARVRVLPGQEHLVTPRMSFKLHQALVLPGCWLRMSPSCHVEVISVLPEPQFPDQPLRIVPSTRLVLVSRTGAPPPQEQQEQEVHQHSSDMQLPEAHTPGRGRRGELKLHSELKKSVPGPASAEVHGLRDSAGGMWEDACGSSKSEAVLAFEGVHPPHVQDVEPSSVHECKNNPSAAGKYGRGNVRQTTAKGAAGRNIGPLKPCSSSQSTATAATATAAAVVAAAAAAAAAVEPSQLELTAEGADGVNPDEVKALVSDKSQGKAKAKSKAGSASGPGLKTGKSGSKSRSGNKGSNSGALTSSASLFDALRDLGDDD